MWCSVQFQPEEYLDLDKDAFDLDSWGSLHTFFLKVIIPALIIILKLYVKESKVSHGDKTFKKILESGPRSTSVST